MNARNWTGALVVAGLILTAGHGAAAELPVAVQLSYGTETHLGIGARLNLRLLQNRGGAAGRLSLVTSFDYFFPPQGEGLGDLGVSSSYFEINENLVFALSRPPRRGLEPYVGGGLNIARASVRVDDFSDTETNLGINVLAGARLHRAGSFVLFGELRYERGGGRQTVLTAGIFF